MKLWPVVEADEWGVPRMRRRVSVALAACLVLGIGASCRTFGPFAPKWHYGPPPDKGVWTREIRELEFRTASFQDVLAELNKAANEGCSPKVSIGMRDVNPDQVPPVTLNLHAVKLCDALRYIAEITNIRLRYSGHAVEFTACQYCDGLVYQSVEFEGRATDSATAKPLKSLVLVPVSTAWCMERALLIPVEEDGRYRAQLFLGAEESGIPREGEPSPDVFLKRQVLRLDVSCPGYSWQTYELVIGPTNYANTVDVELTPVPNGKGARPQGAAAPEGGPR